MNALLGFSQNGEWRAFDCGGSQKIWETDITKQIPAQAAHRRYLAINEIGDTIYGVGISHLNSGKRIKAQSPHFKYVVRPHLSGKLKCVHRHGLADRYLSQGNLQHPSMERTPARS